MKKPKPDLVLINPCSRTQVYQGLGSELAAIENPVWAGLAATFARQYGLTVEVIDAEADQLSPHDVAQRVSDLEPVLNAIIVYGHQPSASTQMMPAAGAVASAIKDTSPLQKVLMLGGHVAALPERTLREEACDFVAVGEGLFTLVDLVRALKASDGHPELRNIRGLWYRDNGVLRVTPSAPLVQSLDVEMPGIAWDLFSVSKYRAHNWHCLGGVSRQPYAAIYTTLGCPYHCTFCCIQAPFKNGEKALGLKPATNSYRYWSPRRIGEELEQLANAGVRNVKIADEMFVLNTRHVLGICDEIVERNLDLNIWAYARIDTVKEGVLPRLKAAGFNWLAFGIEAANARVQSDIEKRFREEEVYETIAKVKAEGINVIGNFIFGLPEDDRDSMQETLDLALELNCEFANFNSAMAYPGSRLYESALENGWELPASWSGYSQHSVDSKPLATKSLTSEEVLSFRDAAFQKYFTSASYLTLIRDRFGEETVHHIRRMTSQKLERHYLTASLEQRQRSA